MVLYQEFTYTGVPIEVQYTGYRYTNLVTQRNSANVALSDYSISENNGTITSSFPGDAPLNSRIRIYMGYDLGSLLSISSEFVYKIKGA